MKFIKQVVIKTNNFDDTFSELLKGSEELTKLYRLYQSEERKEPSPKEMYNKNVEKSFLALFECYEKLDKKMSRRFDTLEQKLDKLFDKTETDNYDSLMKAQVSAMDFWNSKEDEVWDDWDYDLDKDEEYLNRDKK